MPVQASASSDVKSNGRDSFEGLRETERLEALEIADIVRNTSGTVLETGNPEAIIVTVKNLIERQKDVTGAAALNVVANNLRYQLERLHGRGDIVEAARMSLELSMLDTAFYTGQLIAYSLETIK